MDPDDALQNLLKSTGWSCDDLLARLQKIKSSTAEPTNAEQSTSQNKIKSSTAEPTNAEQSTSQNNPSIVSFPQIDAVVDKEVSPSSKLVVDNEVTDSNVSSTLENVLKDAVSNANLEIEDVSSPTTRDTISSSTIDKQLDETFSDTDEEELEINATNSNIINEIIDDISTIDSEKSQPNKELPILKQPNSISDDKTQVTEVRVIEVDEEEKLENVEKTVIQKKLKLQQNKAQYETITIQTEPPRTETKYEDNKKIEYVEIHPRKRYNSTDQNSLNIELKEKPLPNNIKLIKKLPLPQSHGVTSGTCSPKIVKASTNSPVLQKPHTFIFKRKSSPNIQTSAVSSPNRRIVQIKKLKKLPLPSHQISPQADKKFQIDTRIVRREFVLKGNNNTGIRQYERKPLKVVDVKEASGAAYVSPTVKRKCDSSFVPISVKQQIPGNTIFLNNPDPIYVTAVEEKPYLPIDQHKGQVLVKSVLKLPNLVPISNKVYERDPYEKISDTITTKTMDDSHTSVKTTSDLSNAPPVTKKPYMVPIAEKMCPSVFEDSDDEFRSNESPSLDTLEDLRNSLKLQLNSLRNRKKNIFLTTPSTNLMDNLECSKKLALLEAKESPRKTEIKVPEIVEPSESTQEMPKRKSVDIFERDSTISNTKEDNDTGQEMSLNEDDLYTQTNELGLVILDVQGGVELDEPENEDTNGKEGTSNNSFDNTNVEDGSSPDDAEDIRVFDQIRNIINKQKSSKIKNIDNTSEKVAVKDVYPKKMDISSLSGDNSQSSFVETTEIEEKSPFISDTLDEFLTASRLNISYQVPKLGAEDGLHKFQEESIKHFIEKPLSPLILKKIKDIKVSKIDKVKNTTVKKAKTVAQKRRMLERERRKELKRLERKKIKEERKLKDEIKLEEEVVVKKEVIKPIKQEQPTDKSYVLFQNNKIWVNSHQRNTCVARINCTKEDRDTPLTPKSLQRKKLSLLCTERKRDVKIRYSPGPLCKKQNLQISGNEKWESNLLKLPQIMLEVTPKVTHRFCNDVLHRFSSVIGGELDTNQIEFALSMVQTKNNVEPHEKLETFKFPLPYQNKIENILVRRKKLTVTPKIQKTEKPAEVKVSRDPVVDVIEDLIRYVEIKELAPSLIKEEDVQEKVEDKLDKLLSPIIENNVSVFKKPQRKRSKIEIELLRLNCKVVNVEVEESEEVKCKKPFCELGCVCKSLKCEYIPTHHCQKVACMFKCTCPEEKPFIYDKLTLPPGTNILSEDAVTRIEDEAKKNLAKVEREFTQTVIHTNDKTIVVGIGSRTKTRRSAKIPAKFSDFVPSTEAICEEEKLSSKCRVTLTKLNLDQIIPYCLTHDLYDCYCKGQALWKPKYIEPTKPVPKGKLLKSVLTTTIESSHKLTLRPKVPKKYHFDTEENELDELEKKDVYVSPAVKKIRPIKPKPYKQPRELQIPEVISTPSSVGDFETNSNSSDNLSPTKRPVRTIKKRTFSEDFVEYFDNPLVHPECQRTKPINKKYLKSYKYSTKVFENDFIFNITDSNVLQVKLQQNDPDVELSESELLKQALIQERLSEQLKLNQSRSKRKQVLMSRAEDVTTSLLKPFIETKSFNEDAAIQRRKKLAVVPVRKSNEIQPIFDGEIIVDEQNLELLKKMGPKTVAEGYARLLPWLDLMNSFHNNTINIWSMVDQPSRLLINKIEKKCPKNYVNIRESTQMTEVIMWILKNKLPSHYHEDSLSFILKETKDNFEICGICTKNITSTEKHDIEYNRDISISRSENEDTCSENDDGEIFFHKDLKGEEKKLILRKEKDLKFLRLESMPETNDESLDACMWIRLPNIHTVCKWRMIFLNSDFTYLLFRSVQYSIRYTDLLSISEYAKKNECTVSLINEELQKGYDHTLFGIYFDGKFSDRVFIGPYFRNNNNMDDDLETLRYINKHLISTESFNKMRGKENYKCGYWVVQTKNRTKLPSITESTIDLTTETEESISTSNKQDSYAFSSVIMHNNQEIKILDAPPRKPEDFNRYIITNIPYFGYLGALTHPTGEIDVSWPFENKLLRFKNENLATSFLQERFSSLLQSVPESFNITIIVSVKIDLTIYKPIDSSVLNGHYICGDFGYYNIMSLSESECLLKIGVSKESILKLFAKRAQNFVRKKIELLADILNEPKNQSGMYDLPRLLNRATEEVSSETKKERKNIWLKKKLFMKKRKNALTLHGILSKLPTEQRNLENMKFRAIMHKTEPIEIHDSDEESNKSETGNKFQLYGDFFELTDNEMIFKTPSPMTYPSKKLKSVLKPLVSVPVDQSTLVLVRGTPAVEADSKSIQPTSESTFIKGIKLVKTSNGYMLVSDKPKSPEKRKSAKPTRLVIQDNKVKRLTAGKIPSSLKSSNASLNNMLASTPSSSNNLSSKRSFRKKNPEEMYNIDETIIIDLDNDEDGGKSNRLTELHIMGRKVVKKFIENVENNESSVASNSKIFSGSNNPDLICDKESVKEESTIIDLDQIFEEAIKSKKKNLDENDLSQKMDIIDLDESEDNSDGESNDYENKSPPRPEFVSVQEVDSEKMDYSKDTDISVDSVIIEKVKDSQEGNNDSDFQCIS